jgi:hypothetical protein
MRWFCSLYGTFGKPAEVRSDGHAATLEEAKAQFESAWKQRLAWAKLREDKITRPRVEGGSNVGMGEGQVKRPGGRERLRQSVDGK